MEPDYQVELPIFRGPLDLLLFLVKREEVDIRDIPMARITEQYHRYLYVLKLIDFERVGDFLVMAATLMEIKSKLLLPAAPEEQSEEDDPRLELVRQLIEYKKFKDAAALLDERSEQQATRLARIGIEKPQVTPDLAAQPIRAVELWDLVSAFGRLVRETTGTQTAAIVVDETPIHVHIERILARLREQERLLFADLFEAPRTRGRLVGLFLAMLELIKRRQIRVDQDTTLGDIWIELIAFERPPDQPADSAG